jgi:hypothetical protein
MKFLSLCAALLVLNSCNTTIGLYRDTKAVFLWTKGKIQGSGGGDGGGDAGAVEEEYGAPVY